MPGGVEDDPTTSAGASAQPPGLAEMVAALTGAFQNLSSPRGLPAVKLSRFSGFPHKQGDPTINEWLQEFDEYCSYYKLGSREEAKVLLTHLTDSAKDEARCYDSSVREDSKALKKALKSRYGLKETVQPLSTELHARVQKSGETLADFSSGLIRLYDRMESAASGDERAALTMLRDNTLKERFVTGVRDKQIQRELRRILFSAEGKPFIDMRKEVLQTFQDDDTVTSRPSIRECEVETARASVTAEDQTIKSMKSEITELKETLKEVVQAMRGMTNNPRQSSTSFCYNCNKKGHLKRECNSPTLCYGCKQTGHMRRDCPREVGVRQSPSTPRIQDTTSQEDQMQGNIRSLDAGGSNKVPSLVSTSPKSVVGIAGVPTGCILDTGAEASLIPVSYYEEQLKEVLGPLDGSGAGIRVVGINESRVPVIGYIHTFITLNGQSIDVGFLVINDEMHTKKKTDYPVLLGCNALRPVIRRRAFKDDDEDWRLVEMTLNLARENESTATQDSLLSSKENKVLPPLTVHRVECLINDAPSFNENILINRPDEQDSSVNPLVQKGLDVYDTCTRVDGPDFQVTVVNRSTQQLEIMEGMVLASATEVKEHHEIIVQEKDGVVEVDVMKIMIEPGAEVASSSTQNDSQTQTPQEGMEHTCMDGESIELPVGVKLDHLSGEEADSIAQLLAKHRSAFAKSDMDLGNCKVIPHQIRTSDGPPIRLPYRRIPPNHMPELKALLQEMLEKGIIKQSCSPYASPVVPVRKKDGSMRICIDYRQLNARTVRDSFPLPRIEETLEALGGAKFFSSLDLANGYFQIAMDENSIDKTAFRVPWGLFEFLRMPQGLVNSPSTFQRVMELVLGDLNLTQLVIYLDDILVFSSTLEEHLTRLEAVFRRLTEYGLKLKGKKCQFLQEEVHHLGHVVTASGISVDPKKIETIKTWSVPKTTSELRSFLGLASYYRRFVPGFASIATPMHALIGHCQPSSKKSKKRHGSTSSHTKEFVWTEEVDKAFCTLKDALTTTPVLGYPQFGKKFVVEIDASLKGLGACLSQHGEDGGLHPLVYASRGLRQAERSYPDYSSFKLELLGLKWAIADKFREYLIGSQVEVLTDHNPLAHLGTAKLGATEQRWVAQLAPFDLQIRYRPGRTNKCADALSRRPVESEHETMEPLVKQVLHCSVMPVEVEQNISNDQPVSEMMTPGVLPSYDLEQLSTLQQDDGGLSVVLSLWRAGWKPGELIPNNTAEVRGWLREWTQIVEKQKVLFRRVMIQGDVVDQLLVPVSIRQTILQAVHEGWGHQGVTRTLGLLRSRCFWPGLQGDVRRHIKKCFNCTVAKAPTPTVKTPMRHLLAFKPLEVLGIDFLKMDRGKGGYENILVMSDVYTKYAQAIPCRDQTAHTVARVLRDSWFVHYGIPLRLHSDQGRDFEGNLIQELCVLYGIKKSRTTPYHPEGNGQVERFNRTLCSIIRSMEPSDRRKWPETLSHLVFIYNTTPHRSTGYSPYRLMYGREPSLPIDQLLSRTEQSWDEDFVETQAAALSRMNKLVEKNLKEIVLGNKIKHDKQVKSSPLEVGQQVLLKRMAFTTRHKLKDKFYRDPYVIVDVNREGDVYSIRPIHGGKVKTVNRKLLIPDPRSSNAVVEPPIQIWQSNDEDRSQSSDSGTDESSSEEEGHDIFQFYPLSLNEQEAACQVQTQNTRRSNRLTKGVHGNPYHLPRSTLPNS
eukprot:XP_011664529.1 PREDICTED: transposon Ty3-I Gag-Pol polyprotein [Strongylocentrotus purpuratus]